MGLKFQNLPEGNSLTKLIYELVRSSYEGENLDGIRAMLAASQVLREDGSVKHGAVKFDVIADTGFISSFIGKSGQGFSNAMLLDIAIERRNKSAFDVLLDYLIRDDKGHSTIAKQRIILSAIYRVIGRALASTDIKDFLLPLLVEVPDRLCLLDARLGTRVIDCQPPLYEAVQNYLRIAGETSDNYEVIVHLLISGASPAYIHSSVENAVSSPLALVGNSNMRLSNLLNSAHCFQQAIGAYHARDAAGVFQFFSEAVRYDMTLVLRYLANSSAKAIRQISTDPTNSNDYRYLTEFMHIFVTILTSPLNKNNKYSGLEELKRNVANLLLTGYVQENQVSPGVHKLFASQEEKIEFFTSLGLMEETLTVTNTQAISRSSSTGSLSPLARSRANSGLNLPIPSDASEAEIAAVDDDALRAGLVQLTYNN